MINSSDFRTDLFKQITTDVILTDQDLKELELKGLKNLDTELSKESKEWDKTKIVDLRHDLSLFTQILQKRVITSAAKTEQLVAKIDRFDAKQGNVEAMIDLAKHYGTGTGIEKNKEKAFKWIQRAAQDGESAEAIYLLANCYFLGNGISENKSLAIDLYKQAVQKKHTPSMIALANFFNRGDDVTEEEKQKAFKLFQQAAEKGDTMGMYNTGLFLMQGRGVDKNAKLAFDWFAKGSDLGHKECLIATYNCYKKGIGIKRNSTMAFLLSTQLNINERQMKKPK